MKKTVGLILLLIVMVALLAGCGSKTQDQQVATSAQEASLSMSEAASEQQEQPVVATTEQITIDWHTETFTWSDTDGYSYEVTLIISPWILRSNTSQIESAWAQIGASSSLPMTNGDWSLTSYNNHTTQRQISGRYDFSAI